MSGTANAKQSVNADRTVWIITADFRGPLDGQIVDLWGDTFVTDYALAQRLIAAGAPIRVADNWLECPCCKAIFPRKRRAQCHDEA